MRFVQFLKEVVLAKKYSHIDKDIGLLRRVGGYWRVESPKNTLGVAIKLFGSDRFGPNSTALNSYKKFYREKFDLVWSDAINLIVKKLESEKLSWYTPELELVPLEIIFGDPKMGEIDMAIAFSITEVDRNEFYANFHKGQFKEFGGMYCYHES